MIWVRDFFNASQRAFIRPLILVNAISTLRSRFPPAMLNSARTSLSLCLSLFALIGVPLQHNAGAQELPTEQLPADVRRIFESRCLSCHNSTDRKGQFSLQQQADAFRDGYLVAGSSKDSHLISVVTGTADAPATMPKDGDPLTAEQIRSLADWIDAGAAWPADASLSEPVVEDFSWWSFQPIQRPPVPDVSGDTTVSASVTEGSAAIDAFIRHKQQKQGLTPVAEADKQTLIRRLYYDLTGLPPTPEDIQQFEDDTSPDAWSQLVERLLASPRYGERWAQHWLDVMQYADTCGYDKDKLRPNAWPYRDYVIRSFNTDKPYTRFVHEQIAGDVLYPGEPDGIVGLGLIAAGPWDFIGHVEVSESKIDGKVARNLDRDDMVANTLNTFCSITIQCARCHNHKFDPFTQEHYYSLQSVFAAVDRADRPYDLDPATEQQRRALTAERDQLAKDLKAFDDAVTKAGGTDLKHLDAEIARLQPLLKPADKQPEFGYHSQISQDQQASKWVEVDLGQDVQISRIVLYPCHDDYAGIGAGFGFPVRLQVTLRSSADAAATTVCADHSQADLPNPGLKPFAIDVPQQQARYVRITATKLAPRSNDFILALAEVDVLNTDGTNVAKAATVTAQDSIEAGPRWRKQNLTDGIFVRPVDAAAAQQFADAKQKREHLLSTILTPEKTAQRLQLQTQHNSVIQQLTQLPEGQMVYAAATHFKPQGNFKPTEGKPRPVRILHRGDVQQPREEVRAGTVPLAANQQWQFELDTDQSEGQSRAALAQWITAPENPLTWRSVANRIWQHHFGAGLVASPNDFGRMGQLPTHPELLDWLADEFRRTQSLKHLHRLIVNTATWRQQSTFDATNAALDSDNQFLWRMNRRRLSAEEVRDSVLMVSGQLNLEMGGPGFYLFALEKTQHSPHYQYHKFDPHDAASHRRSVYRFVVRSQPDPFMTTLDCADSSQSTPRRTETLTSLQALSLLNNRFTLVMAEYFAQRVQHETADAQASNDNSNNASAANGAAAARRAFLLACGRKPTADEAAAITEYAAQHGLKNLCRVLLNTSEFVFVD